MGWDLMMAPARPVIHPTPDEAGVEVHRDDLEDISLAEALPSHDGSLFASEGHGWRWTFKVQLFCQSQIGTKGVHSHQTSQRPS